MAGSRSSHLGAFGQAFQVVDADASAKRVGQQIEHQHLAGVGLGGRHTFSRPARTRKTCSARRASVLEGFVGDADGERALFAGAGEHQVGVGGFAGLRDGDDQRFAIVDARVIERVDGGRGQRHRNAGRDFQEIAAELRGVVGGAAGGQHDQARAALGHAQFEALDAAEFGGQGTLQGVGLLADFFEHAGHGLGDGRGLRAVRYRL
jgi:hypothetical protein